MYYVTAETRLSIDGKMRDSCCQSNQCDTLEEATHVFRGMDYVLTLLECAGIISNYKIQLTMED